MRRSGPQEMIGLSRWPARRHVVALMLIATVLVCHGAYGTMHQVKAGTGHAGLGPASAHAGHAVGEGSAPDHARAHAVHEGPLDCLTALLFPTGAHAHGDAAAGDPVEQLNHIAALLLVSAIALVLALVAKRFRVLDPRCPMLSGLYAPRNLPLPARPSLARLQVLRL